MEEVFSLSLRFGSPFRSVSQLLRPVLEVLDSTSRWRITFRSLIGLEGASTLAVPMWTRLSRMGNSGFQLRIVTEVFCARTLEIDRCLTIRAATTDWPTWSAYIQWYEPLWSNVA